MMRSPPHDRFRKLVAGIVVPQRAPRRIVAKQGYSGNKQATLRIRRLLEEAVKPSLMSAQCET
jgi:hypothetical protein